MSATAPGQRRRRSTSSSTAASPPARPAGRASTVRRRGPPLPMPSREEIRLLPAFDSLPDESIIMVAPAQAAQAADEILTHPVVGFDTESKPVFVRGQAQQGPHLAQFAVAGRAWLFSMLDPASEQAVARLMATPTLWKVGFGLASDRAQLTARLGQSPAALIDLDAVYRQQGYRVATGIRMAVALTFGRYFEKSRAIGKSDWSRQPLNLLQRRYAAHDAWGAFRVYQALTAAGQDITPGRFGMPA